MATKYQGAVSRQTILGALVLLSLIWGLNYTIRTSNGIAGVRGSSSPEEAFSAPKTSPSVVPVLTTSEQVTTDRPLVLYAYAESANARENLQFFLSQGIHGAADFIFIFNGESNATSLIPREPNISIIQRPNSCFDLGAYGEVLKKDDLWRRYRRFITLNASIRGPFIPHWAQGKSSCWSDLYLNRVNEKVKLVGMTANCMPRFHVQSMIFATDRTGMELLLFPPPGGQDDDFGEAADPVAFSSCYYEMRKAIHAEVGTTEVILRAGYQADVMMTAFHQSPRYAEECHGVDDVLFEGMYYGSNVHPYETIFIKANRDIDPVLLSRMTEWHLAEGRSSWDTCGRS